MLQIKKELQNKVSLWSVKFTFLWIASIFSSLSISMYLITEQWYVVNYLDLKNSLGLILTATTLPRVLLMLIGGVIADRHRRSKIIFLSLITRCIMLVIMAIFFSNSLLSLSVLFIFALLFGASDAFFWSARDSIIPKIVSKDQLVQANSVIQTTNQISVMLGPVVGAALLSFFSYSICFIIIATSLLVSALLVYFLKEEKSSEIKETTLIRDLRDGISFVKDSRFLLTIMGTFIIVNLFFIGPLMLSIPIIANDTFGGKAIYLSILQSSFATGMLLGAIIMGLLNIKKKRGILTISLVALEGILLIIYSQTNLLWLAALILLSIGICVSSINIPIVSLIQESTPTGIVGRVMSINTMVSMGLIPISYALVSALLNLSIDIRLILLYAGSIVLLFTLLLVFKASELKKA
ncbi:MFS transporter [Priestia megaterium]|uniref:MFS transporter n=1 Tax=Priestia megaterium TaxID=1404 RepID=UPI0025AF77B0|nr:MFS transporter [Priestia megaterium]MDN3362657.1 MFS transporter [Priestia megaterium]WKU21404.1 MFS transporter [Priestia megaterium]